MTKSASLGNCFTMKILKPFKLKQSFFVVLNRKWDLIVFVHNEGDEFWLPWSAYPPADNKFRINMKSDPGPNLQNFFSAEMFAAF